MATCSLFGIDRQVYYRTKYRKKSNESKVEKVIKMVTEIRNRMPRIGTRKLYYMLEHELQDMNIGRDKLFSILRANHLMITPKRSYRITTDTHHRFHKHKDIVQYVEVNRPEQVWVADITYLGYRNNHLYLSLITDAYSKKIVGYDLSNSLQTEGSVRALKMANKNRMYPKSMLIHHSDKGLQYCSNEYQLLLGKFKMQCSMTENYDPYSNAIAERVNGIIKNEFCLENYMVNKEIMPAIVKETIEIYNNERPHFSCSLLTPNEMHRQNSIPIKSYKTKNRSKNESTSV